MNATNPRPARRRRPRKGPAPADPTTARVLVSSRQRRLRVPRKRIEALVSFAAQAEGKAIDQIDVAVVGNAEMAHLNEAHLRHRGPTDVLSFDLAEGPEEGLCAQIIVCADVAISQARRRDHSPTSELLLYITHGLLHAFGYDDHRKADAQRMHAREDELLEAFGVGRVYGSVERVERATGHGKRSR